MRQNPVCFTFSIHGRNRHEGFEQSNRIVSEKVDFEDNYNEQGWLIKTRIKTPVFIRGKMF